MSVSIRSYIVTWPLPIFLVFFLLNIYWQCTYIISIKALVIFSADHTTLSTQSLSWCRQCLYVKTVVIFCADSPTESKQSLFWCRQYHRIKTIGFSFVQTARCIKTVVSFGADVSLYLSSRYFAADRTTVSQKMLLWYRSYHRIKTVVILVQTVPPYQDICYFGTDSTTASKQSFHWYRPYHRITTIIILYQNNGWFDTNIAPYQNTWWFYINCAQKSHCFRTNCSTFSLIFVFIQSAASYQYICVFM